MTADRPAPEPHPCPVCGEKFDVEPDGGYYAELTSVHPGCLDGPPVNASPLREAIATMAPVHVGQMYAATDKGDVQYRADDCLYRGEVLATLDAARGGGLDVMILRRALERGLAAVDDEWTIEELADLTAAAYDRLRGASDE